MSDFIEIIISGNLASILNQVEQDFVPIGTDEEEQTAFIEVLIPENLSFVVSQTSSDFSNIEVDPPKITGGFGVSYGDNWGG